MSKMMKNNLKRKLRKRKMCMLITKRSNNIKKLANIRLKTWIIITNKKNMGQKLKEIMIIKITKNPRIIIQKRIENRKPKSQIRTIGKRKELLKQKEETISKIS